MTISSLPPVKTPVPTIIEHNKYTQMALEKHLSNEKHARV